MRFYYRVVDQQGRIESGKSEAESREKLIARFKSQGQFPLEIREQTQLAKVLGSNRLPAQERLNFTQQLAGLLAAGIPLERSLGILSKLTFRPELATVISQLRRSLQEGLAFTAALERFPKYFPPLYVSMVRAGEAGGILPQVLQRLANYQAEEIALRRFIVGSLIYPGILMTASLGAILIYVGVVIPKFQTIFNSLGSQLPLVTRIVLFFGQAIFKYWLLLLMIMAGAVGWFIIKLATPQGRLRFDRLKLRLPLLGPVLQKVATAKLVMALSLLNGSGVPLLTCLQISSEVVGNQVLAQALIEVEREVKRGSTLANSLAGQGVFPVLAVEMIGVGEESGKLGTMLDQVAHTYENEVRSSLNIFLAVFEPFLILTMVGVIALLAMAILLPVLNLSSGINV